MEINTLGAAIAVAKSIPGTAAQRAEAAQAAAEAVAESIPQDYSTLSEDVREIKSALSGVLSEEAKEALLACFAHTTWTDAHGHDYYDALESALYRDAELTSISAVFTQGQAVIHDDDALVTLKQYLVVTAHYSDGSYVTVTSYTLSGQLIAGTSTITVAFSGKTTSFSVTVSSWIPNGYTRLAALKSTGTQYIDTGINFTNEMKYEIEVSGLVGSSANTFAFGVLGTGNTYMAGLSLYGTSSIESSRIRAWFRGYPNSQATVATNGLGFIFDTNTKYKCAQKGVNAWLDGEQLSNTFTEATWTIDRTFKLFCRESDNGIGGYCPCYIYGAKFYDGNDDLIHYFIPCLDDNNVPCMYDAITETVKYNLGTGTFDYVEVA